LKTGELLEWPIISALGRRGLLGLWHCYVRYVEMGRQ
jgi:hypothetical protein